MSNCKPKSTFMRDLKDGKCAENLVQKILESKGFSNIQTHKGTNFDLSGEFSGENLTFEVKYDIMSEKTGNIAIEFYNPKKMKPSGISATKADYWIIVEGSSLLEDKNVWIITVEQLKETFKNNIPKRIVFGGDNNSTMYLYDKEFLKLYFKDLKDYEFNKC